MNLSDVVPMFLSADKAAELVGATKTIWLGLVAERHAPQPVWIVVTGRWRRQDLARWISGGCQPTCEQAIPSDPQKGELK